MNTILRTAGLACILSSLTPFAIRAQEQPAPAQIQIFNTPADQQPTDEQLAKLFQAMRLQDQMMTMTKSMSAMVQQQTQRQIEIMQKDRPELQQLNEDQKQAASKAMGRFMERVMATAYSGDDLQKDMTDVYRRHLTRDDVDALIALFSSQAGQHMLAMAPAVMQELVPSVMARMQERMKPLVADFEKEMMAIARPAASQPAEKK